MKKFLMTLALMPLILMAKTEVVGGIEWTYTMSDGKVLLGTGTGSTSGGPTAVSSSVIGPITIPSELGEKSVTIIGKFAFYRCDGITSVSIPSGVMSIGGEAFGCCTGLQSVSFPSTLMSIDYEAFYSCSGLTTVTFPRGLTSIGGAAFYGCSGLKSVTIPRSVTSIGSSVFYGCDNLRVVYVDKGDIGRVKDLYAWSSGLKFEEVDPPKDGTRLEEVIGGMTWLGTYHEGGTIEITSVEKSKAISAVAIPSQILGYSVVSIGEWVFDGCDKMTSVVIPEGVTSIGAWAFADCSSLERVSLPSTLQKVGKSAFRGAKKIARVDIDSIEHWCSIDYEVERTSQEDDDYYDSIPTCPQHASGGTATLYVNGVAQNDLIVPEGVALIPPFAFWGAGIKTVSLPSTLKKIGAQAFGGGNEIGRVTIADFTSWCDVVPQSIMTYDGSSISGWSPLRTTAELWIGATLARDVVLPDGIQAVRDLRCSNLERIVFPGSVKRVLGDAFSGCPALTSVRFMKGGLEYIGDNAFGSCSKLACVYFDTDAPNVPDEEEGGCVYKWGNSNILTTYVLAGTTGWKKNGSTDLPSRWQGFPIEMYGGHNVTFLKGSHGMIASGDTVRSVCNGGTVVAPVISPDYGWRFVGWDKDIFNVTADMMVTALYEKVWQDGDRVEEVNGGVTWYGTYREGGTVEFGGCSQTSGAVTIPQNIGGFSVTTIGDNVFSKMWSSGGPTAVVIPEGVTRIGQNFFFQSKALSSVVLPASLTNIASGAFSQCAAIADIVFPADVVLLGAGAFSMCDSLTNVTFAGNAPTVGEQALSGLPSDCIVWVERGTTGWGAVPGVWNGIVVRYIGEPAPLPTFGEALGATSLAWATSGDADWLVESDEEIGHYVARSGAIGGRKCSVLSTVVTGRGTLTFKWKVSSCSEDGYLDDYLSVCVDGEEIDGIGGEVGWVEKSALRGFVKKDIGVLSQSKSPGLIAI